MKQGFNEMDPAAIMGLASVLIAGKAKEFRALSIEEQNRRRQEVEAAENKRIRTVQIIKNICPVCEGKLIRGRKNKRNDYKREWKCKNCHEFHSL